VEDASFAPNERWMMRVRGRRALRGIRDSDAGRVERFRIARWHHRRRTTTSQVVCPYAHGLIPDAGTMRPPMDGLDLIKTFREVAFRRSFSRAAISLGMSKATVSRYVAELETRSGDRVPTLAHYWM